MNQDVGVRESRAYVRIAPAGVVSDDKDVDRSRRSAFVALWPVAKTLGDLASRLGLPEAYGHYEKALAVAHRVGVPRWVTEAEQSLGL